MVLALGDGGVEGVRRGCVKKGCDQYRSHLQERVLVRSDSVSHGPDSSEGAKPSPSTDEMTSFHSKVNAKESKVRGSQAGSI